MIPLYGYATVLIMPLVTFVLFGMDAVAREIQDPFGFDENVRAAAPFTPSFKLVKKRHAQDLNIQGYENVLIDDIDTVVDGRLRLDNVDGMEAPGNEELTAETETKENLFALNPIPWKVDGKFEDARLKALARKKTKVCGCFSLSLPVSFTSCSPELCVSRPRTA